MLAKKWEMSLSRFASKANLTKKRGSLRPLLNEPSQEKPDNISFLTFLKTVKVKLSHLATIILYVIVDS